MRKKIKDDNCHSWQPFISATVASSNIEVSSIISFHIITPTAVYTLIQTDQSLLIVFMFPANVVKGRAN